MRRRRARRPRRARRGPGPAPPWGRRGCAPRGGTGARWVGLKEAPANRGRAQWLIRAAPKGFAIYSGDDATAVALMLCGGQGNVSVTANLTPRLMHDLCVAAVAGDARRAMDIQLRLLPLHKHLFAEPNPIPVKWAMQRMGLCGGTLRLPMTPLTAASIPVVEGALRACGLV